MSETRPPPLVLIIGSGRSGTSWIGRIFDSLDSVLYLHEPDLVIYDPEFPVVPDPDRFETLLPHADALLDRLAAARPLKAVASRPIFRKSWRRPAAHHLRVLLIYGLRLAEEVLGNRVQRIPIPDMIDKSARGPQTTVIKSVTGLARLSYFATVRPDMPILHVMRHPCGMVASLLRGIAKGKMPRPHVYDRQLALPPARRRGLDRKAIDRMSDLELSATLWTIMHEWALERCPEGARVLNVRYDDLCADPLHEAQKMLSFCGLPFDSGVEAFIRSGLEAPTGGKNAYHSVIRNPAIAANKWREELSPAQIERIHEIVGDSVPGRLFAREGSP
ncbi:MAG: hypothetical protein Tsb008_01870 [Rhodothalassiaceae bacterium]